MHVNDGGGTYISHGSMHAPKWKIMIGGLQYTYDYVPRNIKTNFKTDVDPEGLAPMIPIKVGTGKGDVTRPAKCYVRF